MRSNGIRVQLMERIISALSYITFGIAGVIWVIVSYVAKNRMSSFCSFNVYQSIFFSFFLYILSLICSIAAGLLSTVPFLGKLVNDFNLFFTQTPIYFGYSLWGLVIFVIVCYLAIFSLLGKYPYLPFISDVIGTSFRR